MKIKDPDILLSAMALTGCRVFVCMTENAAYPDAVGRDLLHKGMVFDGWCEGDLSVSSAVILVFRLGDFAGFRDPVHKRTLAVRDQKFHGHRLAKEVG